MLTPLLASYILHSAVIAPANSLRILFFGNSHTVNNDVPGMVKALLESSGRFRVMTETRVGAFLTDIWENKANRDLVLSGKWNVVVLQAAKLSSSHRYNYSHEGGINLANLALKSGANVFLFAEWPRRGWDETGYILSEYGEIAVKAKGTKILPIPQAWDRARKAMPKLELWQPDGNHATSPGSYLAACVIAMGIAGSPAHFRWGPQGIDPQVVSKLRSIAFQRSQGRISSSSRE